MRNVFIQTLHLLTRKSVLYVCNADENHSKNPYVQQVREKMGEKSCACLFLENWNLNLRNWMKQKGLQYLETLEMDEPALNRLDSLKLIHLLNLITFFTASSKEVRGWTIKKGSTAPQAGGSYSL